MTKNITKKDLIRLLYNETTPAETQQMCNAIIPNNELLDQYDKLHHAQRTLEEHTIKAPQKILNNILNYSKLSASY